MKPTMRHLLWLVLLIVGWTIAMDWHDELRALRPEYERQQHLRAREQQAAQALDWGDIAQQAATAQLAWLQRLPEIPQTGIFRAQAMENMADLCNRLGTPCQVSAMGESATPRSAPATNATNHPNAASTAADIPGLFSTSVRLSVPLNKQLLNLLQEIESGPVLRKIERFTVRGSNAEIIVKTFGLELASAQALQKSAQAQAASAPQDH